MPLAHRYPRLARARLRTEMTFVMMLLGGGALMAAWRGIELLPGLAGFGLLALGIGIAYLTLELFRLKSWARWTTAGLVFAILLAAIGLIAFTDDRELSDSLLPLFLWGSLGAFLVSSEATLMFELANRRPDPATASVDMSDDTPGSDSATGSD